MTQSVFPRKSSRRAGFTLLEIMIVVGIIALLASIAIPGILRAKDASRRTVLVKQVQLNMAAFELYAAENNKLPLEDPTISSTSEYASVVPPGMATYMPKKSTWTTKKDGVWRWYYWPGFVPGYKGFFWLFNPLMTTEDITFIDQKLDDGNINTGAIVYFNNGGNGLLYGIN